MNFYYLLGFSLAAIIIYSVTIIEMIEIIKRNMKIAVLSFLVSLMIIIANLVLTTTEYIYLSAGFTTTIASFIPLLMIKYIEARRLDAENKEIKSLIEEKKRIPPILFNVFYDCMEKVKRDYEGYIEEAAMKNIFLLMFERIQAKHNSMEISKEQYNEIRPARALIKPT